MFTLESVGKIAPSFNQRIVSGRSPELTTQEVRRRLPDIREGKWNGSICGGSEQNNTSN